MVKDRFPIPSIKGVTPAVDARNTSNEVFVIEGRNFLFDSKGPKSGFGTRLLAGGTSIEVPDGVVQTIPLGQQEYVFTTKAIYQLSGDKKQWEVVLDLAAYHGTIPWKKRWTAAYLSNGLYFCHRDFGLFKQESTGFNPKTKNDIPGLPDNPIAIGETNGRLITLGHYNVAWSAPSEAENFMPTLGGAGQQRLSDRVAGNPIALSVFKQGFLVWTDIDCLIGEYIGGDQVFRFDRLSSDQLPVGAWAIEDLPDGSQLLCTKQGIYQVSDAGTPKAATPIFNEFLRGVLKHEDFVQVRLTYIDTFDLLYVQLRDWTDHYVRTYVLSLALDKWGLFSDRHYGIIRYGHERGAFGYVDNKGVAHKFVDHTFNREVGADEFVGLDSEITIGYIKPPRLNPEADTLLEMQEILLGGRPVKTEAAVAATQEIDCGALQKIESGGTICLDFESKTYAVDGSTVLLQDEFTGYDIEHELGIQGYGIGPSYLPVLTSLPAYANAVEEHYNTDKGFTWFVALDLGDDPTLTGSILYISDFVDGSHMRLDVNKTTREITFEIPHLGVRLVHQAAALLPRETQIAICIGREIPDAMFRTSLSVNGSAPEFVDLLNDEPFGQFATDGFSVSIGGAPASVGAGFNLSADCELQRLCLFGPVADADLMQIAETGELIGLNGYDMEANGFVRTCNVYAGPFSNMRTSGNLAGGSFTCGLTLQVPDYAYGGVIPQGTYFVTFGRSSFGGIRMAFDQVWERTTPLPYDLEYAPRLYRLPPAV